MSDRIKLGAATPEAVEQVEVELYDRVFVTRPLTRSIEHKLAELDQQIEQAADSDEAIRLFGQLLGCLLIPTGGQKKTPGALLEEAWQSDRLSLGQIASFVEQVQEAAAGQRPT